MTPPEGRSLRGSGGRGDMQLVCHMGSLSGKFPPNSLEAIRECFEQNVPRIEIDIHSLDGPDYIVFHDRRLETHTTGQGSVGHATPDDIRSLHWLDRDGRPPLLSEIVELARGCDTELQLDWKDWRLISDARLHALRGVVTPLRERVIISTGQDWNLRRLRAADPNISFGFDPGHYVDHASEGTPFFLPRTMGAYGYRDEHPLALGKTEPTADYLEARMESLALQAPGAREYFLSYKMVLQMLDDGFDVAAWLHARGVVASAWTLDHDGPESERAFDRLAAAGIDCVTTNTTTAWQSRRSDPGR